MTVKAPFAFARINRRVWFPEWAELVSHDVPFADGYCGSIEFDFELLTPLLVGGPRRRATAEAPGEVWPFRLPDGRYAVPASSLQGMVRNVLEVATFGKLAPFVDDLRFGLRDITPNVTGKALYGNRIARKSENIIYPRTKAGWLVRSPDGPRPLIVRCELARIEHSEVAKLPLPNACGDLLDVLERNGRFSERRGEQWSKEAPQRYEALLGPRPHSKDALNIDVTVEAAAPHEHSRGPVFYARCRPGGPTRGTLVITGKPLGTVKPDGSRRLHTKHLEFVFHSPDRSGAASSSEAELVEAGVWRDFLSIHRPDVGSGKSINPNWAYWQDDFLRGLPVPIFYLEEKGKIRALGTAFMLKMAMPLSTHDLLRNSSRSHVDRDRYDLPSLIFGASRRSHRTALKKRASFDMAVATIPAGMKALVKTRHGVALLNPKPNYYPIYVRQHPYLSQRLPEEAPYATYASLPGPEAANRTPELAGVKIWPATYNCYLTPTEGTPPTMLRELNALPVGTRFERVMLRVHNLRAVEIGALLWALTFGQKETLNGRAGGLCHKLGMGKPFGLGSILIEIAAVDLLPNDGRHVPDRQQFVRTFEDTMEHVYSTMANDSGRKWAQSPQVLALLKSANPELQDDRSLTYLDGFAGYAAARRNNEFLGAYVPEDGELPRENGESDSADRADR